MSWQLQLVVTLIYFYVSGNFAVKNEWPWAIIFACYAIATIALIWAQPK